MMFSSRTPRDLNHDPLPSVNPYDSSRWRDDGGWSEMRHDPRPEFDHVQHNEPNPILVALRGAGVHREAYIRGFFASDPEMYSWPKWSAEHIDHARRVLTRLAHLTEGVPA